MSVESWVCERLPVRATAIPLLTSRRCLRHFSSPTALYVSEGLWDKNAVEEITPAAGTLPLKDSSASEISAPAKQEQHRPDRPDLTRSQPSAPSPAANPAQPASTPEKQKVPTLLSLPAAKTACQWFVSRCCIALQLPQCMMLHSRSNYMLTAPDPFALTSFVACPG